MVWTITDRGIASLWPAANMAADMLEHMSLVEGEAYNNKLMPIARGDVLPDRSVPVEYIMYDLWNSMREHDDSSQEILEPVFTFMRAQTDSRRLKEMDLKEYFEYREHDVGKGYVYRYILAS